jgi:threonine dehydrogenase-like Zn-dependent dehydrogenase
LKALYAAAPGEFGLAERPRPVPGSDEVLLRVAKAGLCPNELRIRDGVNPSLVYPRVPGHQFAGVVEERGPEARYVEVGDRAAVHSYVLCGQCAACRKGGAHDCDYFQMLGMTRDGGLAEYCAVPARHLFKLPDHLDLEEGAMVENVANAVAAVREASMGVAERVVVVGTSPIGMASLQVARMWSPSPLVIVGTDPHLLDLGLKLGATHAVDIQADGVLELVRAVLGGRGADVVIVCASTAADAELAMDLAGDRGRIVIEGHFDPRVEVSLSPFRLLVSRRVTLKANRGWLTPDFTRALELVSDGVVDVKPLTTHRFSLEEWEDAYETFATRAGHTVQVAIGP